VTVSASVALGEPRPQERSEQRTVGIRPKILVWDASGLVLVWKQLQQGGFRWPPVMDGVVRLSAVEFAALFDGLDWTQVQAVRRIPTPTAAG